jgi:high-affinity nickel-transport protein
MPTVAGGVAYLIFFGAGSIAGMGIVATVVGAPLAVARRRYPPLFRALATTAGLASLAIGVVLFWNAGIRHRLFS